MATKFKYIDLEYLISTTGENNEMITEMIDVFLEQIIEFDNDFDSLVQSEDFVEIGKHAHKVKSSILIVGMSGIVDTIVKLEAECDGAKDLAKVQAMVKEIKDFYHAGSEELKIARNDYVA